MNRKLLPCALLAVAFGIVAMNQSSTAAPEAARVLRHVVLFKFKADATKEQVQDIVNRFEKLPKEIDVIKAYEMGLNNSTEMRSKGFTHCFLVTFADEKGRDAYLPHPSHQAFVKVALPLIEDVLVVDYWSTGDKK